MDSDKSNITRKLLNPLKGDKVIWFIFLLLVVISLVSVFSATGYPYHGGSAPLKPFFKHTAFVLVSLILAILLSNFDYRRFSTASWAGYLVSILLLIIALTIGSKDVEAGSGMGRWIKLPLIGRFQPSELAKIVIIVYLARMLTKEQKTLNTCAGHCCSYCSRQSLYLFNHFYRLFCHDETGSYRGEILA